MCKIFGLYSDNNCLPICYYLGEHEIPTDFKEFARYEMNYSNQSYTAIMFCFRDGNSLVIPR